MTDSEYLSQRKELENRIAQLDAAHLNDREYMDGDHVRHRLEKCMRDDLRLLPRKG